MGSILWLYQTQRLLITCASATGVTWYFTKEENLRCITSAKNTHTQTQIKRTSKFYFLLPSEIHAGKRYGDKIKLLMCSSIYKLQEILNIYLYIYIYIIIIKI